MPLTVRLLELLYRKPEIWVPYKEMCLPDRILTSITMSVEELRDLLGRPPISASPLELKLWENGFDAERKKFFAPCIQLLGQLTSLVLPSVNFSPAELTWAYSVTTTRAALTVDDELLAGQLIPLVDMMNHASHPLCDIAPPPSWLPPGMRAELAVQADPAQLRVVAVPGKPTLLMRGERLLGRLDDCAIIRAPKGGLRPGDEALIEYHPTPFPDRATQIAFALTYGFCPP